MNGLSFKENLLATYNDESAQLSIGKLKLDVIDMLSDRYASDVVRTFSSNTRMVLVSAKGSENVLNMVRGFGFLMRDENFDKTLVELCDMLLRIIKIPNSYRVIRVMFHTLAKVINRPNSLDATKALTESLNKFAGEVRSQQVTDALRNQNSYLRKHWRLGIAQRKKKRSSKSSSSNVATRSLEEDDDVRSSFDNSSSLSSSSDDLSIGVEQSVEKSSGLNDDDDAAATDDGQIDDHQERNIDDANDGDADDDDNEKWMIDLTTDDDDGEIDDSILDDISLEMEAADEEVIPDWLYRLGSGDYLSD